MNAKGKCALALVVYDIFFNFFCSHSIEKKWALVARRDYASTVSYTFLCSLKCIVTPAASHLTYHVNSECVCLCVYALIYNGPIHNANHSLVIENRLLYEN